MEHDILIIGGGAAGIMAAITAKDMGANVAILECNDRIGRKILTTGNGRCNISNENISANRYHSENPDFCKSVLNTFDVNNTIDFFSSIGLPLVTLEDGKMYPMSLQASSVLDILRLAINEREIPVYLNSKVKEIKYSNNSFKIFTSSSETYECKKLILSAGGKAAPATGSDGSGFKLAKGLGHNIISPVPALVQLKLKYNHLKALSGIKFDGTIHISIDNVDVQEEFGEVLFTDYGISGPPVLSLSRVASKALLQNKKPRLKVCILHNMNFAELEDFIECHFALFSNRSVHDSFIGVINKKLIPIILKEALITDIHKPCMNLSFKEKHNIISLLHSWEFEITDTTSFANSQVTAGGVNTNEVNNSSLESYILPGLYFAGEVLDVDGDCGGFNLQWAWCSGFVAGKNAAL